LICVNVADGLVQDQTFHNLLHTFVGNVAAADVNIDQREVLLEQREEVQAAVGAEGITRKIKELNL
jgi:hypothetical protein